ncbi:hypothetical protein FOL47_004120, partial [Perkinsus chesapeaki]
SATAMHDTEIELLARSRVVTLQETASNRCEESISSSRKLSWAWYQDKLQAVFSFGKLAEVTEEEFSSPPWFFNLTAVPVGSRSGCDAFEMAAAAKLAQRRGIPWIAVARRGGCFFQNKTMNAIVINSKEGAMVRWMDGVLGVDLPLIPTALVGHEAAFLMDYNDPAEDDFTTSDLRQITLTKPGPAEEKVHSRIAFVCDESLT